MINNSPLLRSLLSRLSLLTFLLLVSSAAVGQVYNDGPIDLSVRVRDINTTNTETDAGIFGVGFRPDELTYKVWVRDNADVDGAGWFGGGCLQDDFSPPTQSIDFNSTLNTFSYLGATVPQFFDLRLDAHEDDLPSDGLAGFCNTGNRCDFNNPQCCGVVIFGACIGITTGDDNRCNANPFRTAMDYRQGPPCQWYNHGYVVGTCPSSNFYQPRIESFWRYTRGTGCANAIQLGNATPGMTPLTHFNSNECYTNNWAPSPGNDVFYEINVTQPMGLVASVCAAASFNTNLYVLDASCTQIGFNNNFCAQTSEVSIPLCAPGTYYVVIDGNTAPEMGTFTLTIDDDPTLLVRAEAGNNRTICVGTSAPIGGSPTAQFGASPYTYSWTPTNNLSATNIANPVAFPAVTTQYYVDVTDNNGCTVRDSVLVTVNPGPVPFLGNDTTLCSGDSITLDAGAGYISYFWSNGSTNQSIDATFPGIYHVSVIDLNGCLGRDTIEIFNFPLPGLSLGPDTSICVGASLFLNAGPGMAGYAWQPGGQTSQGISVTTAGTYSVTITNFNGCQRRDTINVGINSLPLVSLGPDVTKCPGIPTTLDPGPGFVTYTWNTASNNQTIAPVNPGQYDVTVTDINGCASADTIDVFDHTVTPPNLGPDFNLCAGIPATLNAGAGYTSYAWNTGASAPSISIGVPGTYWVEVTDGNGCISSDTVVVGLNAIPSVDIGPDTTICIGASLSLDAGPGFSSYNWSNAATTQTTTVNGQGTYSVTVTDANGCTATDQIVVTVDPGPVVSLGADTTKCTEDAVILTPGPGFASYSWTGGSSNSFLQVSQAGSYTVTVTNANGCSASDTKQVFNYPIPQPNLGPDQGICNGGTVVLNPGASFSGYAWNTGANSQTITATQSGSYYVFVADNNGCVGSDTVVLNQLPDPVFDLGNDTVVCNGGAVVLDAGPGWSNVSWSTGPSGQTLVVSQPGTYAATVTDANGCTATDQITVTLSQPVTVNLGNDTTICDSGMVMLDAGAGLSAYLWGDGSTNQYLFVNQPGTYTVTVSNQYGCSATDDIVISAAGLQNASLLGVDTVLCSGNLTLLDPGDQWITYLWDDGTPDQYYLVDTTGVFGVEVTDDNGCRFYDDINITVNQSLPLDIGNDTVLCPGATITLDAGAGFDLYEWSTGQSSPSIEAGIAGTYSVRATFNNCAQIDAVVIRDTSGEACQEPVYIPNAFSPNGDFLNDYFGVVGRNFDFYHLMIFDRYNKLLFDSKVPTDTWDGFFNGRPMPEGVYMYRLDYRLSGFERSETKAGSVTLIR